MPGPRSRTILVVEDDPDIAEVLSDSFEREGYRAVVVEDGHTAVDWVDLFAPDLITLDLSLPEIDGHGVLRELKRFSGTRQIPVIVITAFPGQLSSKERGLAAAVIAKPFDVGEVVELVRSFAPTGSSAASTS